VESAHLRPCSNAQLKTSVGAPSSGLDYSDERLPPECGLERRKDAQAASVVRAARKSCS
jgi:hypothetical protein